MRSLTQSPQHGASPAICWRRQGHTFRRRQNGFNLSFRPLSTGTVDFDTTDLFLLTTADLAESSAAFLLQPVSSGVRDEAKALHLLQKARTASTNDTNARAYKAFDQLNPTQHTVLVSRVQVLGRAPDIDQVKDLLR